MTALTQMDLWGAQWEARHQNEISNAARRIGTDPEALAAALKHADRDHLEEFARDLIAADSTECVRTTLYLFCLNVAKGEH